MSQQIMEAQGGDAIIGSHVAASDPGAVTIEVDGEWGTELRTVPLQGQGHWRASGGVTEDMPMALGATLHIKDDEERTLKEQRRSFFKEIRFAWLMVLATFTATISFQAGLNPPGGFWQADDSEGHHAGDPVLRDKHHSRYLTFYYLNVTTIVTSLVIMVIVLSERFYYTEAKVLVLILTTIINVVCLVGAYIAGTAPDPSSWIYIVVIVIVTVLSVTYMGELMAEICSFVMMAFPYMETLAQKRWCPIPKGAVEKAKKMKDDRRQRRSEMRRNNGTC